MTPATRDASIRTMSAPVGFRKIISAGFFSTSFGLVNRFSRRALKGKAISVTRSTAPRLLRIRHRSSSR